MNEREKWLVIQGFIAGYGAAGVEPPYSKRVSDLAKQWLDDCVADGVTVEMLLDKEMQDGDEMSEPTLRDEFALSAPAERDRKRWSGRANGLKHGVYRERIHLQQRVRR